jgi:hypothetical protein
MRLNLKKCHDEYDASRWKHTEERAFMISSIRIRKNKMKAIPGLNGYFIDNRSLSFKDFSLTNC